MEEDFSVGAGVGLYIFRRSDANAEKDGKAQKRKKKMQHETKKMVPENNRNRRNCIWLHEQFLDTFSGYSPLDWVERA